MISFECKTNEKISEINYSHLFIPYLCIISLDNFFYTLKNKHVRLQQAIKFHKNHKHPAVRFKTAQGVNCQ